MNYFLNNIAYAIQTPAENAPQSCLLNSPSGTMAKLLPIIIALFIIFVIIPVFGIIKYNKQSAKLANTNKKILYFLWILPLIYVIFLTIILIYVYTNHNISCKLF